MSATLTERAPYQEVLAYERVISEEGTRFSKTGYMIHFDEAVERMGADPMRYLYCAQPVATELRFGYTAGDAAARKLIEIWNVYGFFVTYALIDRPFCAVPADPQSLGIADRWLLARTAAHGRRRDRGLRGVQHAGRAARGRALRRRRLELVRPPQPPAVLARRGRGRRQGSLLRRPVRQPALGRAGAGADRPVLRRGDLAERRPLARAGRRRVGAPRELAGASGRLARREAARLHLGGERSGEPRPEPAHAGEDPRAPAVARGLRAARGGSAGRQPGVLARAGARRRRGAVGADQERAQRQGSAGGERRERAARAAPQGRLQEGRAGAQGRGEPGQDRARAARSRRRWPIWSRG